MTSFLNLKCTYDIQIPMQIQSQPVVLPLQSRVGMSIGCIDRTKDTDLTEIRKVFEGLILPQNELLKANFTYFTDLSKYRISDLEFSQQPLDTTVFTDMKDFLEKGPETLKKEIMDALPTILAQVKQAILMMQTRAEQQI